MRKPSSIMSFGGRVGRKWLEILVLFILFVSFEPHLMQNLDFSEEDWLKFSWKSAFQSALTLTFCSHILLLNDYNCVFVFQPQTVDEVTVDPVQDDIEIVNEGEGTDAFAVSSQ